MSEITTIGADPEFNFFRRAAKNIMPTLKWRHHGIGALQAYASEGASVEHRIHIWSPELVKVGMDKSGDVHDHRFKMKSHVLAGMIRHEEWLERDDPEGQYTMMRLTNARAAAENLFHGPTQPLGNRLSVSKSFMTIMAGQFYTFPAFRFHRNTVAPGLAVTWVEKHEQRDDVMARLLHPIDVEPVMAFGHEPDQEQIAKLVAQAIGLL